MDTTRIGILRPGAMGSAVGAALRDAGLPVAWSSRGRSASGPHADAVARALDNERLGRVVLDAPVGGASALKAAYATWTKGTVALLAALGTRPPRETGTAGG